MEARREIGLVFGFLLFLIWVDILLQLIFTPANESMLVELFRSTFEGLFKFSAATSKYLTFILSGNLF